MEPPVRRRPKINGWRLVAGAFLTGCLLVGAFWLRSHQTSSSDAKLCRKIDKLDAALLAFVSSQKAPQPGEYGYDYWRTHHKSEPIGAPGGKPPKGLVALLRAAACDPKNLPSTGGKP
jgi:hypothetical protein